MTITPDTGPGSAAAPPPARAHGRRLLVALCLAVAGAVGAGLLTTGVARVAAPAWADNPDRLAPMVMAAVYGAIIAALLSVLARRSQDRALHLGLRPAHPTSFALGLAAWICAYLIAAGWYVITAPLGSSLGTAVEVLWSIGADNGRLRDASLGLAAVILLRACLLAPIAEELLFRGALFSWLRARLSAPLTIALTSIAFALIHQVPQILPLALIVGLAAGWLREQTGSTWVPIALHITQNIAVVGLSFAATGWDPTFRLGG